MTDLVTGETERNAIENAARDVRRWRYLSALYGIAFAIALTLDHLACG